MAELQFPNIAGSYQQGLAFGRQLRSEDEARRNQSRLSELAAQAYGASPEERGGLIQQAIGINPEAGFALGGQFEQAEDRKQKALLQSARLLQSAPPEARPALYQRIRPQLSQYLPDLPPEYNEQVEQGTQAYISAYGGAPQRLAPHVIGRRLIGSEGEVLYEAPQEPEYQWSPEAGKWIPKPMAGGPALTPTSTPEGMVNIDPSLPKNVRDAIAASPSAFDQGGTMQIPNAQGITPQGGLTAIPVQGVQPRPNFEAERFRLSEEAAARDQRRLEMAEREAEAKAAGGRPALSAGEAAKVRQQAKDQGDAIRTFREFEDALAATPNLATSQMDPRQQGRLQTAYANARAALRIVYNTGVLQPGELPMLEAALANPTGWRSLDPRTRDLVTGQLEQIYTRAQGNIENLVNSYPQVFNREIYNAAAPRPVGPRPSAREVTTQAEYDALPSGAIYLEDGVQYRKP